MITRRSAALPALLLTAALLSACGGAKNDHTGAAPSTTPADTSTPASTTPASTTPSASGTTAAPDGGTAPRPFPADTAPDTGQASAGAALTVTDIRIGHHDGYDRVVFQLGGRGTPGWDTRYVDEAVGQARGDVIPVKGNAVLQVTIRGVGYPTDTGIAEFGGSRLLPAPDADTVTEVVWNGTFEGTSVAFVGTTARTPFRVYLLQAPTRVVLDVVHHQG